MKESGLSTLGIDSPGIKTVGSSLEASLVCWLESIEVAGLLRELGMLLNPLLAMDSSESPEIEGVWAGFAGKPFAYIGTSGGRSAPSTSGFDLSVPLTGPRDIGASFGGEDERTGFGSAGRLADA
jgi:hypothetical protein